MSETTEGARRIEVFAASCSGLMRVSLESGMPLVCIRAACLPAAELAAMNGSKHAARSLRTGPAPGLEESGGWTDWAPLPFEPLGAMRFRGVAVRSGRLHLTLPAAVAAHDFEAALHRTLGSLRFDLVAGSLRRVSTDGSLERIHPLRFSGARGDPPTLAEDLFVLNPARQAAMVACRASAVRERLVRQAGEAVYGG